MKLSDDQLLAIRELIATSTVTIDTLKDDLLDHLCCVVEIRMERGSSFETALREALHELAPNGLDEIQRETLYLLNSNKILTMKKVMYSIGLVCAISISLGWLFSVLHWPGGSELFNYGFLGFMLLFVPMLTIDRYKVSLRKALSEKLRIIFGVVSALLTGLAAAFKFLHLAGADILLLTGMVLFTFGFLPFLFFNLYKKSVS